MLWLNGPVRWRLKEFNGRGTSFLLLWQRRCVGVGNPRLFGYERCRSWICEALIFSLTGRCGAAKDVTISWKWSEIELNVRAKTVVSSSTVGEIMKGDVGRGLRTVRQCYFCPYGNNSMLLYEVDKV